MDKGFNEYYYKIGPRELCKFFNIKYRLFDKILINFCRFCRDEGENYLELIFSYKKIFLGTKSINKFLKAKGYNRFRMQVKYDDVGSGPYIYGLKLEKIK